MVIFHGNVGAVQLQQLFFSHKPEEMIFPTQVYCGVDDLPGDILDAIPLNNLFGTVVGPGAARFVLRAVRWIHLLEVSPLRLRNKGICLARISMVS